MLSITNQKYNAILKAITYFEENDISISKCSRMFNIHRETLSKYLKEYNLYEDRRSYVFNEDYFKTIDSEDKAYWLGFIVADGCIKNESQLSIGLSYKDINHLKKLKKDLKSEHPIKIECTKIKDKEYKTCAIRIKNKKMFNDLLNLNIEQKKSTHEKPTEIPQDLIRHYIRGMFDGDGWISWNKNCAEIGFGMGSDILNYIKHNAEKYANVKEYRVLPFKSIFRYRITSKCEIIKMLNYMYKDSTIYLDRKYEKYLKYCRLESKSQKAQDD